MKPKVLFLVNWWYPDRVDPLNGIFIKKHAEAVSRVADVAVLYLGTVGGRCPQPPCTAEIEGNIPTIRVYYAKAGSRFAPWAQMKNQIRYWRAMVKGWQLLPETFRQCDVVHVHLIPPPIFLWLRRSILRKIPFIITEHSSQYLPINLEKNRAGFFSRRVYTPLQRRIIRAAAAVTVPSLALQQGMVSLGFQNRYFQVPNVVDIQYFFYPTAGVDDDVVVAENFASVRDNNNIPAVPTIFKLLHVSNLKRLKNVRGILAACALLKEQGRCFEFHIVGDGEERAALEKDAAAFGMLNRQVFFLGRMGTEEVAQVMRRAHIFILFSDYENSPCVIAEAHASGLPVVASRVGGVPEMINQANGRLVGPGNEKELATALVDVMNHWSAFDRNRIAREAAGKYNYDTVGRQFLEIYRECRVGECNR